VSSNHIPDVTKMIIDGGPAFPRTGSDGHTQPQSGMTLRDYFAAAALQGMLSDPDGGGSGSEFAHAAYSCADAMIKAREAK
jgi:hypothetical protein